jgi:transposase
MKNTSYKNKQFVLLGMTFLSVAGIAGCSKVELAQSTVTLELGDELSEEDGNKCYGKSKENRPNPIVTMGLFMDADGIPLAFDIFPGNQNEQTTLKPLESTIIRDFNCSEFIFCSDAGLGSVNNRRFNSLGNRSYVITHSIKKMKNEDKEIALSPKHH